MRLQAVDTVFVQAPRDALSLAADWALVVVAVAIVMTAVGTLFLLGRTARSVRKVARSAEKKADPLLERSRSVAANVEFITATLRTDVEGLHQSVRGLADRLKEASSRMETRVDEFNALMDVVQGEAEDVFIDTASTARGVRAGARSLIGPGRSGPGPTLPDETGLGPHPEP
jgi:hypothetical protein